MFVMAAPGDAILAAGGALLELDDVHFLNVTDGAPQNLDAAVEAGFLDRVEYARALQREFEAALDCAGLSRTSAQSLDFVSGAVAGELATLTMSLAGALREAAPSVVITHAYSGANADHDAIAFAVQAACAILQAEGNIAPTRIETALSPGERDWNSSELSGDSHRLKLCLVERMPLRLREFKTHAFDREWFRVAPEYDFAARAHSAPRWRKLAADAMRVLGLVAA